MTNNIINHLERAPKRVFLFAATALALALIPASVYASTNTEAVFTSSSSDINPVCELTNPTITANQQLLANGNRSVSVDADIAAGNYNLRYTSFDAHSVHGDLDQDQEQWVVIGFKDGQQVFGPTAPTRDIPAGTNTVTATLALNVAVPMLDRIDFVHAAGANVGPQSVFPTCLKFIEEESPAPQEIDLRVRALVDGNNDGEFNSFEQIPLNRDFVWRFVVENEGDVKANGVQAQVFDLPAGLTIRELNPSHGTLDENDPTIWNVGMLEPGEKAVLLVTTKVGDEDADAFLASDQQVSFQVTAANEQDVDSTVNNFAANEDDQDNANVELIVPAPTPAPTPEPTPEPTPVPTVIIEPVEEPQVLSIVDPAPVVVEQPEPAPVVAGKVAPTELPRTGAASTLLSSIAALAVGSGAYYLYSGNKKLNRTAVTSKK